MEQILNDAIVDILSCDFSLIQIAIRQKAKFEGWLKFELANYLISAFPDTRVEYQVDNVGLVDIYSNGSLIELKTANTNYQVGYCEHHTRPITLNIQSILDDIDKMNRQTDRTGYIAFVLFPIDDHLYLKHVESIEARIKEFNKNFKSVKTVLNFSGVDVLVFTSRVC